MHSKHHWAHLACQIKDNDVPAVDRGAIAFLVIVIDIV